MSASQVVKRRSLLVAGRLVIGAVAVAWMWVGAAGLLNGRVAGEGAGPRPGVAAAALVAVAVAGEGAVAYALHLA